MRRHAAPGLHVRLGRLPQSRKQLLDRDRTARLKRSLQIQLAKSVHDRRLQVFLASAARRGFAEKHALSLQILLKRRAHSHLDHDGCKCTAYELVRYGGDSRWTKALRTCVV